MNYYSAKKRRGLRVGLIVVVVVILVGLVAAVAVVRTTYNRNTQPYSNSSEEVLFTVRSGATAHDIAVDLYDQKLIRAAWAFEWYIRRHNLRDDLQAGSYYLRPNQSVQEIASVITSGKVATDLVTILPAQRLDQIEDSLVKSGFSQAQVRAALEPAQYANHPALVDKPAQATLEGYLYPDSFQRTAETTPEDIIGLSLDVMHEHLTPEIRAGFVEQGLTVHEGITLASIVEKETGNADERPTVAQVFLKRLAIDMQLGSDVTSFYGAEVAGQEPTVAYDSPYNTRIYDGLPPGPISNVSKSSLQAVAYPSKTDYLFFVAGDDGVTHFSNTLAEHEAATAQYCTTLCQ
ncbi:hypothetical protein CR970_03410 [Candidatus Saccharibacteria bacterium]|nr:MAG: hypothetical protein CR970_03410 [Candidatus Saccharibacteria bacterium]